MNKIVNIQTISVDELKKHYDSNQNLCLIDVRELSEWQEMHIPKAIHIAKDELKTNITKTNANYTTPIYLHCRSGVRSLHAANTLLELGYTNVYSVDGGIIAWFNAGFPIDFFRNSL